MYWSHLLSISAGSQELCNSPSVTFVIQLYPSSILYPTTPLVGGQRGVAFYE